MWKVVGAAARGAAHDVEGLPCQDAFCCHARESWVVAAVADGAGSAVLSHEGAGLLTRRIVAILKDDPGSFARGDARRALRDAVGRARSDVAAQARASGRPIGDFQSTLVGLVADGASGLLFHVGDGVGVAVGDDACAISRPENGAYADETYFVTDDDWESHLRFEEAPFHVGMAALMSDGAASFVMAPGLSGFDRRFMDPVSRFLEGAAVDRGERALHGTLSDPRTHAITSDDKCLVWARWLP